MAAQWETERVARIESKVAHRFAGPVIIRNVRLFDSKTAAVTAPLNVAVIMHTYRNPVRF